MSRLIFTRSALADALQSWPPPVLDPAGPFAGSITTLTWALIAMAVGVLGIVVLATWIALKGNPRVRARLGGERLIWIGGVAFPMVVLTALLVWGLALTSHISAPVKGDEMRIRVTGEMWWWRVAYLDPQRRTIVQDANEIHIPAGQSVILELDAADVIHSFWVPRLSGKLDMIPGRRNVMRIQADRPGIFAGQCAEYCGGPHALMGLVVIAHPAKEFADWLRRRQAPPIAPTSADAIRGAQLFASSGCAACHRVAGTTANGLAGPDLTAVGSRRTLGAGILPNNRGTMIGWIGNSQAIKPANRMPAYPMLSADELRALGAYLESLK